MLPTDGNYSHEDIRAAFITYSGSRDEWIKWCEKNEVLVEDVLEALTQEPALIDLEGKHEN